MVWVFEKLVTADHVGVTPPRAKSQFPAKVCFTHKPLEGAGANPMSRGVRDAEVRLFSPSRGRGGPRGQAPRASQPPGDAGVLGSGAAGSAVGGRAWR